MGIENGSRQNEGSFIQVPSHSCTYDGILLRNKLGIPSVGRNNVAIVEKFSVRTFMPQDPTGGEDFRRVNRNMAMSRNDH